MRLSQIKKMNYDELLNNYRDLEIEIKNLKHQLEEKLNEVRNMNYDELLNSYRDFEIDIKVIKRQIKNLEFLYKRSKFYKMLGPKNIKVEENCEI